VGYEPSDRSAQTPVVVEVSEISGSARPAGLPTLAEFTPGHRFVLRTGRNEFSLPPGRYHVQLWSQYAFWRVGKATIDIDTTYGPVLFHYAVPYTLYHRGAAGFEPQQRQGKSAETVMKVVAVTCGSLAVLMVLFAVVLTFLQ
jgi:hypothetical protein